MNDSQQMNLEDLVAFNDELAALLRAGLPLDLGLSQKGLDHDGALAKINAAVAGQMLRGRSLAEALEAERSAIPTPYDRMLAAGLRCGRLPAGLEGLVRNVRNVMRLRLQMSTALVYPLFVCGLAYALLIFYCVHLTPIFTETYSSARVSAGSGLRVATFLRQSLPFLIALPPCLLGVGWLTWSRGRGRGPLSFSGWSNPLAWFPSARRLVEEYRCAHFSELLALLISHGVPLEEGVVLSAGATGSSKLQRAARAIQQAESNSQTWDERTPGLRELPSFLGWSLTQGIDPQQQVQSLNLASETYRHKAGMRADRLRTIVPIVLCVVVAGSAALGYALLLFVPFTQLLQTLFNASTTP